MRLIVCLAICLLQIFACTAVRVESTGSRDGYTLTLNSEKSISVKDGIFKVTAALSSPSDIFYTLATMNVQLSLEGASSRAPVLRNITVVSLQPVDIIFNVTKYAPYLSKEVNDPSNITVQATVYEFDTDVQVTASLAVAIYPFRYKVTCMTHSSCTVFEPDTSKKVVLQISYLEYGYLRDIKSRVQLTYIEVLKRWESHKEGGLAQTSGNRTLTFTSRMNKTGLVEFNVSLPALEAYEGYYHYYDMQLKYRDETQKIGAVGYL